MPALLALLLLLPVLAIRAPAASFSESVDATAFLKGNLHAHSNSQHGTPGKCRSYDAGCGDGDSEPAAVTRWYANHGYKFSSLTDHNELTPTKSLPGIELTSYYGPKKLPVHVNAICVNKEVKGVHDLKGTGLDILQKTIAVAQGAGASLIVVNHPAYRGALGRAELTGATGYNGIELASGHPQVEADDAAAAENAEDLWDAALAGGADIRGVAADDAHDFTGKRQEGESALRSPGKAWVQAWAESADALCDALKNGRFYASTGPELASLKVRGAEISVAIAGRWDAAADKIEFLKRRTGAKANVASTSSAPSATYLADGSEGYVRVRITQAGKRAWTQAYRVK